MTARLLFIGLDAAESTLLQAGAARGDMPTLRRLEAAGTTVRLDNAMRRLPGAIWPEILGGVSCGRRPQIFHPRQLRTGEAAPRPLEHADVRDFETFWSLASRAGRRAAAVDLPHMPCRPDIDCLQLAEWGAHDRPFGRAAHPSGLLAELDRRHGPYPVRSCDHYPGSRRGRERLLGDLLAGIERKEALLLDLLGREGWDLFACAFSESHCAGHQFWHFSDPRHADHDPRAPALLKGALAAVYRRLDTALGRLLAAAGPDATVLVLASHGMGPYVAGYQLLPELLVRLGLGSGGARGGWLRRLQATVKHYVPRRFWEALSAAIVENPRARRLLRPLQARRGALFFPLESAEAKAAYLPNNTIGAIRLNLKGREPFGCVAAGNEAASLVEELRAALHELRHPESGEPIVAEVVTAAEAFGPGHHPDVPDLIVVFRTDLGLIEACESPRVGRVRVPVGSRWARRTGDHTPNTRLWLHGPGVPGAGAVRQGHVLDIAPTILSLLGVAPPAELDGRPLWRP